VVLAKKRGTTDLLHMSIGAIDTNQCIVLATGYPRFLLQLADSIHYPQLPILVRHFLFDQLIVIVSFGNNQYVFNISHNLGQP
jgi:hypothetical protein